MGERRSNGRSFSGLYDASGPGERLSGDLEDPRRFRQFTLCFFVVRKNRVIRGFSVRRSWGRRRVCGSYA